MNLDNVMAVSRAAYRMNGTGYLSTGESLTAALVLNRADWLKEMNYSIAEALDRIDSSSIEHLREAERQLGYEIEVGALQRTASTETPA